MKILVVNCGSSSLKYQLIDMETEEVMAKGYLERIGLGGSFLTHTVNGEKHRIERKYAKKLPEGTYFIADLIGLNVFTEDGKLLGYLEDIYNAGSSDIYVVKTELGKQVLLPSIKEVIKQVDLENEKIIVHLLKGLVED